VRIDGYAPIESYAALGDGRSVALVADDGQIDWWPVPAMDSPPAFAAILDPEHGGALRLRPAAADFAVERRYVPGTNVLETAFITPTGRVRVTDALSVGGAGPLPWNELIRRIDGIEGEVKMGWEVAPGSRLGTAAPWTSITDRAVTIHLADQHLGVLCFDVGDPVVVPHGVSGEFTTAVGSVGLLAVVSADSEPIFLPTEQDFHHHLDRTIRRWREWSDDVRYDGPWSEAVVRSALALKLLLYEPTGAIAAAPTTSLPERIGGDKNWDYRFMWVRDSSFTVDALMELGLHEEVQSAVSFLLASLRRTDPDLHVFYTLAGTRPGEGRELDVSGYRMSRPVREGNEASTQTQLGTFGDLFDTIWHYQRNGHWLDPDTGRMLMRLADRCCDIWRQPDSGIWELPDDEHYTISKMGCWVALDRALRLADSGALHDGHVDRWRSEAEEIRSWVNRHCWSSQLGSYTLFAGSDSLDAATLLAGRTGFDRDYRLAGTVAAVREHLADGPLVYRYTGMQQDEGAFLACSFWLVSALAHLGRLDEATAMMDAATALANDVGLLAEQLAGDARTMLGNHPQGLSHLALIDAANTIARLAG
jgi:GH15 family glucan-1,4-alpha-glucosidase